MQAPGSPAQFWSSRSPGASLWHHLCLSLEALQLEKRCSPGRRDVRARQHTEEPPKHIFEWKGRSLFSCGVSALAGAPAGCCFPELLSPKTWAAPALPMCRLAVQPRGLQGPVMPIAAGVLNPKTASPARWHVRRQTPAARSLGRTPSLRSEC